MEAKLIINTASVKQKPVSGVVKVTAVGNLGFAANDPNVHRGCSDVLLRRHGGVVFYHNDHLGTPQALTDQDQNKVWEATYTPFGKATITTATIENPLRFPGQRYDPETGFHYNHWRFYDPERARYTQSDFIGLDGGINTYGYAYQNPLAYTDSTGLFVDTFADIGFILYDLYRIGKDNIFGDCDNLSTNLSSLGANAVGAILPGVTGLGIVARVPKGARTPVGRSGQKNNFPNPNAPKPRNAPETINGRDFSGHAIDRMQERGFTPSVIENALKNGTRSAGNKSGTSLFTDSVNKLRVVTNSETGNVITRGFKSEVHHLTR